MDKKTAEIILNLHQFESPTEAYESQLFKIRNYLFINPVIPSVFYAKQKKTRQLFEAMTCFEIHEELKASYHLIPIKGEHLFDKFICYEANKSHIKKELALYLTASNIELGIQSFIQNLVLWSSEIISINTDHAETVPASRELDAMTANKLFKSNKELSKLPMDNKLLSELKRIQLLAHSIKH